MNGNGHYGTQQMAQQQSPYATGNNGYNGNPAYAQYMHRGPIYGGKL